MKEGILFILLGIAIGIITLTDFYIGFIFGSCSVVVLCYFLMLLEVDFF